MKVKVKINPEVKYPMDSDDVKELQDLNDHLLDRIRFYEETLNETRTELGETKQLLESTTKKYNDIKLRYDTLKKRYDKIVEIVAPVDYTVSCDGYMTKVKDLISKDILNSEKNHKDGKYSWPPQLHSMDKNNGW